MIRHMFIDPASYSTGWAVFENGIIKSHGTIKVGSPKIGQRLRELYLCYSGLIVKDSVDMFVLERMNTRVHYYVIWAVAAILTGAYSKCFKADLDEMSPNTWKKWLKDRKLGLHSIRELTCVDSEDECVAIAMGHAYFKKEALDVVQGVCSK